MQTIAPIKFRPGVLFRHDRRTLQLDDYVALDALPPIPAAQDWGAKVSTLPMLLNDQLGDCAEAAQLHIIQTETANAGTEIVATDADAQAAYTEEAGYNPADPSTDLGTDLLTLLNDWRTIGVNVGGVNHKIGAYAQIPVGNSQLICAAAYLFGPLYLGVSLPPAVTDALNRGQVIDWDVPPGLLGRFPQWQPNPNAGHAIPIPSYQQVMGRGLFGGVQTSVEYTVQSWAQKIPMNQLFLQRCGVQLFVLFSPDWFNGANVAPNGVNLAALQADFAAVTA